MKAILIKKNLTFFFIFLLLNINISAMNDVVNLDQLNKSVLTKSDAQHITLFLPDQNLITLKPTVKFKGSNRFQTPVFISNDMITVRNDGRFYHDFTLNDFGKNKILITFITPENKRFYMQKNVLYLYSPSDLKKYPKNPLTYTYLFNSPYIIDLDRKRKLSDAFTRLDLAHFLFQLKREDKNNDFDIEFKDIPTDFSDIDAVKFAVSQELMTQFPDQTFKPNKTITKLEYIMALVKLLNLPFSTESIKLPYTDINQTHWTTKYIRAAHHHNLIQKRGELQLNKPLTLADFIVLSSYVPHVKSFIQDLISFENGFTFLSEEFDQLDTAITNELLVYNQKLEDLSKISLNSPRPNDLVLGNSVAVTGKIFPPKDFEINGLKVTPDYYGKFDLVLPLSNGKNEFNIIAFDKVSSMNVFSLLPFRDLEGHWVEKVAAQLRHLSLLEAKENFSPNHVVTREEFAHLIVKAYGLTPTDSIVVQPTDVNMSNMYFDSILTTLSLNIFNVGKNQGFNPNQEVSKAQAVTALMRIENLYNDESYMAPNTISAFKDVKASHWAFPTIMEAFHKNMISKADYFFPNKFIKKAELIALISKSPKIKKQLRDYFQ